MENKPLKKSNTMKNPNKTEKLLNTVYQILEECRIPMGENTKITHISMGRIKGKFNLSSEHRKKLFVALAEAYDYDIELNIGEMHKEYGPLLFDIDLEVLKTSYIENSRLYDDDILIEVIELYREGIKKYLDVNPSELDVMIFEKSEPSMKDLTVKDGFHGLFPNICVSYKTSYLIREHVIHNVSTLFDKFNNSVSNIFDKAVIYNAPWLMYGCKKPTGKIYKLTRMITSDMEDRGPDVYGDTLSIIKKCSIQNNKWRFEKTTPFLAIYNNDIIEKEFIELNISRTQINNSNSPLMLNENKKINIEKAKYLLNMLRDNRADDFHDWMRVGWALHNIDTSMLDSWIEFSQRSDKYKDGECETKWNTMKDKGLSIRSLIYWAKEDSPEEFLAFCKDEYNKCLNKTKDTNTYYLAKALHNKYGDKFVCVSVKNNIWYEFKNHKWKLSDNGVSLMKLICDEFINDFYELQKEHASKAQQSNDILEKEKINDYNKKTQKIIDKLLNITFKKQIMDEARHMFYEADFIKKLDDTNKHLIGFENGVYDLEKEEFREGRPDDFISMSTNINYIHYNMKKADVKEYINKIEKYMAQVIIDPEVREYLLLSFASCCSGENKEQKFRLITGSGSSINNGSNGKSLTLSLCAKAFGDYYAACPITLITRKRGASNQASPELARMKGVRIGIFQETDDNEDLNVGIVKELTGGDKFMVRPLYADPFEIQFQAKFFLQCNKLPVNKARDYGTWRRIRVIEFGSRFVEKPNPKKPNEFLIDNNLEKEIEIWAPYFMSYLINFYVSKYKHIKCLTEPEQVRKCTDQYKCDSDSINRFVMDCIEPNSENDSIVKENELVKVYSDWHKAQCDTTLSKLNRTEFIKQISDTIGEAKNKVWVNINIKNVDILSEKSNSMLI
jgi:P4 family phage/plasmid primase-like protien